MARRDSRTPSHVVALEYGPSSLKFLEMPLEGDGRVSAAGVISLDPMLWRDADHVIPHVRAALARTECRGRNARLIASVPAVHAFLRVVEIPDEEKNVPEAVQWDMARYLARPLDLYALDYRVFTDAGRRYSLAAAYRQQEIQRLREVLESAAKLPLAAVDVDILAVVNAFAANYPERAAERTVILKADLHGVACARTRAGEFFGGSVRRAAEVSGAGAQEHAERLLERANAAAGCLANGPEEWRHPDHIAVCGDLGGDPDFLELLKTRLLLPFSILDPFRAFTAPDPVEHPSAYPRPACAAALGMALRLREDR